jgi:hypothetical protein
MLATAFAVSASASRTIIVGPGQSIQAAVDSARPGDTVLVKAGVYRQSVLIRTDLITLRGSGDFAGGTVLKPPASFPRNICNAAFGRTGVCILAKKVNTKTGWRDPVRSVRSLGESYRPCVGKEENRSDGIVETPAAFAGADHQEVA